MNWIISKLDKMRLFRYFQSTPIPRWLILVIDMCIIFFSCSILIAVKSVTQGINVIEETLPLKITLIMLVYLIMELITKSYQYIIRLSVMADLYRIFVLVLSSTLILFFLNFAISVISHAALFSYWDLTLIGLLSFTILHVMRLTTKYLYMRYTTKSSNKKRVIVLGSALNSYIMASALKNEVNGKYEPVALLSLSNKKGTKDVNGIPIIPYVESEGGNNISSVFEKYNADTLIFLATQIELMRNGFADPFLANGIKLLVLNQVEEFEFNDEETPVMSSHIKNIEIEDLLGRPPINNENPLISENISGECVLITGAAGSIGSEIVRQVATFGARKIILVDQAETPMHNMQLEMGEKYPNIQVILFIGDVKNRDRIDQAFAAHNPKFVFHAAAYKHVPMMENNPSEAILTNVMGTKNLADLAIQYKAKKFVMISTDKAVNPTNIMGTTKRIAEIYVQSLFFENLKKNGAKDTTQFITTRFGNVLGSNGSVIPHFRQQIENGGPVTVTDKRIIRYFMTIKEACSLVLEAGCMGKGGEIYVFDMGKPIKIYDLATRMITLAGLTVGKDIQITEIGLRPGEKLYEELLNDKEATQATVNQKIMIAKVRQYDFEEICNNLNKIITFANNGDIHSLVVNMKLLVPEYISQNSEFEAIDTEIIDSSKSNGVSDITN